MNMHEYVEQKEVKISELKENFRLIKEFSLSNEGLNACGNCKDKINTKLLPAESWFSALYCWKCGSMTIMDHADHMSGNHYDYYKVYGAP